MKSATAIGYLLAAVFGGVACSPGGGSGEQYAGSEPKRPVVLATTTSTYDTGLLDHLIPRFEKKTGLTVKTVAVGTGQALELGRRGEADVLLVHAPSKEQLFVDDGNGKNRRAVMHNDFVIVGPGNEPSRCVNTGGKSPVNVMICAGSSLKKTHPAAGWHVSRFITTREWRSARRQACLQQRSWRPTHCYRLKRRGA